MLFAINDIGAHGEEVTSVHQYPFDPILDLLDMQPWQSVQPSEYRLKQTFNFNLGVLPGCLAGGNQCLADLVGIEGDQTAIALVQAVTSY